MVSTFLRILCLFYFAIVVFVFEAHAQSIGSVVMTCTTPQKPSIEKALKIAGISYFQSRCPDCTKVKVKVSLRPTKPLKQAIPVEDIIGLSSLMLESDSSSSAQTPLPPPSASELPNGLDFRSGSLPVNDSPKCMAAFKYRILTTYVHGSDDFQFEAYGDITIPGTFK